MREGLACAEWQRMCLASERTRRRVAETERDAARAEAAGLRAVSQKRFWTELKASFGTVAKERDTVTRRTLYYGIDLEDVEDFS